MGGGELYLGTIAEILSREHDVDLIGETSIDLSVFNTFFGLNLTAVKSRVIPAVPFVESAVPFHASSYFARTEFTRDYDLFFVMPRNFRIPFRILSKNKILHLQVPDRPWSTRDYGIAFSKGQWPEIRNQIVKTLWYPHRYSQFDAILLNSEFHQRVIQSRLRSPNAIVLNPPVTMRTSTPPEKKERVILSVGRFFSGLHSKRQDALVKAFEEISNSGSKLIFAGGLKEEANAKEYFQLIKKLSEGLNVEVHTNVSVSELDSLYSRSSIYWHAAGFEAGELHPEKMEHFGISTVEAMSAGCVPIVYKAGGQLEIIHEGVNGEFWTTQEELIIKTVQLMDNRKRFAAMSKSAVERSKNFSKEQFTQKLLSVVNPFLK